MSHIYNQARFDQKADFSQVTFWGSDVDFFCEVADKAYIAVEWKCVGQDLPRGQAISFKRLVSDLGQVKPTFVVIAEHLTAPSEALTGENSNAVKVLYRLPNMAFSSEYIYGDDVPTLNQWLSDFLLEFRVPQRMVRGGLHFWEGFSHWLCTEEEAASYEYIEDIPKTPTPSEFFDHIRPISDAYLGPSKYA